MTRTATTKQTTAWPSLPRQAMNSPLDTETILNTIVNGCAGNVAAFDERGALLSVSGTWQAFAEELGFTSASETYGLDHLQTCREAVNGRAVEQVSFRESIQRIVSRKQVEFQEEYILDSLDTPRWFMTKAVLIEMPDACRIMVTLEDVTRRRQAEEELRNIGGRLINAQEEERTRLARELHDDLSQRLALLSLEIEQMRPQIPAGQTGLNNSVDRLSKKTQELGSDIHRLSYQLHPFKLDHLGLSAAIESLCGELSAHRELKIKFRKQGFPALLPEDVTLCAFRIAQESLHNVAKHSGASEAQVVVTKTGSTLNLRITDNGVGFDPELVKGKKRLGLISMKERLRLVGGKISIRSEVTKGTQIDVSIPLALVQH
ncbi:MAG TPA: sensor histidine kinase [Pyrinomonadaceae bacterium]|nr:sensor histidine kinase [Pyrinomonadaceae bacterium]